MSQFSNFGPFLLNNIKGSEPTAMWLVSFYSILERQLGVPSSHNFMTVKSGVWSETLVWIK